MIGGIVTPWPKQHVIMQTNYIPPTFLMPGDEGKSWKHWSGNIRMARKFATPADALSHLAGMLGREPGEGEFRVVECPGEEVVP